MSSSTLSERDVYRVRRFDLVLEHSDGVGGGYDGTGCLPCLPWCRKPVYSPGQHITGYLLIRPVRRITITGVKIYFEGLYNTEWSDRSLKWKGRRNFYTDCVHLIRGRLMELDSKWYRFDFEHILPRNLPPSFKTQHCRVAYMATGLVTQPGTVDLHSYETGFQIHGHVDIRTLPASYHQCVSKSSIQTYHQMDTTKTSTRPGDQVAGSNANQIRDLKQSEAGTPGCHHRTGGSSYSQEVSGDGDGEGDTGGGGAVKGVGVIDVQDMGNIEEGVEEQGAWNKVSTALWLNKQAFVIGEELRMEVHIDNQTSITMEAMVQFEQVLTLRPTYAVCRRTSEYVPLGRLPTKRIHNPQDTIWSSHIGPVLTETKSLSYVIPKLLTNITPPEESNEALHRSHSELAHLTTKDREPLIKIQYFVRLKVKPKEDDLTQFSANQHTETVSLEVKLGNCDTGVQNEQPDIMSSCVVYNHRLSNNTRTTPNVSLVTGVSQTDLLDSLDGSEDGEDSVFDMASYSRHSGSYNISQTDGLEPTAKNI